VRSEPQRAQGPRPQQAELPEASQAASAQRAAGISVCTSKSASRLLHYLQSTMRARLSSSNSGSALILTVSVMGVRPGCRACLPRSLLLAPSNLSHAPMRGAAGNPFPVQHSHHSFTHSPPTHCSPLTTSLHSLVTTTISINFTHLITDASCLALVGMLFLYRFLHCFLK
jgi:hypothetical protein